MEASTILVAVCMLATVSAIHHDACRPGFRRNYSAHPPHQHYQSHQHQQPQQLHRPHQPHQQHHSAHGTPPTTAVDCIDIDECRHPVLSCGSRANCVNTPGSFRCECYTGFIAAHQAHYHPPAGAKCVDMNECKTLNAAGNPVNLCADSEYCINLIGTYNCLCKTGFVRDGKGGCRPIHAPRPHHHNPHGPHGYRYSAAAAPAPQYGSIFHRPPVGQVNAQAMGQPNGQLNEQAPPVANAQAPAE